MKNKFIALLRGINVGGKNKIKMADLVELLEKEFTNVKTYIQSGNIIFESNEKNTGNLESIITRRIFDRFNYDVECIALKENNFIKLFENNPFPIDKFNPDKLYFTFLQKSTVKKINEIHFVGDRFVINGQIIYLYVENGYGKTKFNNGFFEKQLGVCATTRNYKTLTNIIELAKTN